MILFEKFAPTSFSIFFEGRPECLRSLINPVFLNFLNNLSTNDENKLLIQPYFELAAVSFFFIDNTLSNKWRRIKILCKFWMPDPFKPAMIQIVYEEL